MKRKDEGRKAKIKKEGGRKERKKRRKKETKKERIEKELQFNSQGAVGGSAETNILDQQTKFPEDVDQICFSSPTFTMHGIMHIHVTWHTVSAKL